MNELRHHVGLLVGTIVVLALLLLFCLYGLLNGKEALEMLLAAWFHSVVVVVFNSFRKSA